MANAILSRMRCTATLIVLSVALLAAPAIAQPVSEQGLTNLQAFARAYGYVRFFHPSDEAVDANWDAIAIRGVTAVEPAASPDELAASLTDLFAPYAPSVTIYAGAVGTGPEATHPEAPPATARRWIHEGIGLLSLGGSQLYRSTRIELPFESRIDFVADLGGGVSITVPTIVPIVDGRTWPVPTATDPGRGLPDDFVPSGDDRATRLADVVIAWNVFQHFYPYFDVVDVDWPGALVTALRSAATDPGERAFLDTLRRLVAELQDGHGGVYHRCDDATSVTPIDWTWVGDRLIVTHAPEVRGVSAGDEVIAINAEPPADRVAEELPMISAATEQWRRYRLLDILRRGRAGTTELLDIQKRDGRRLTAFVPRRQVAIGQLRREHPSPAEVAPGIVYFNLDGASTEQLNAAMSELRGASGIIFDLRGYPGSAGKQVIHHLTKKRIQSPKWLIPLVRRPDRAGMTFRESAWNVDPIAPYLGDKRIAFITDGRAISYAESCLGIVEHEKLGAIVGGPTAGTNGNVNPFALPGGYRVAWTGMRVMKRDDTHHHGVGIRPTHPVEPTVEGIAEKRDELLEVAIEVVSEPE